MISTSRPKSFSPRLRTLAATAFILISATAQPHTLAQEPTPSVAPSGFVEIRSVIPDVVIELRYATKNNFVGHPIDGYDSVKCWITRKAALQLAKVQDTLRPHGLALKIFDAYRPQSAVDHFVRWSGNHENDSDDPQKPHYFPHVKKDELFDRGYISKRSGHSRGSSVDLTIVSLADQPEVTANELDMGTPFDFFDPASWTAHADLTPQQRANRLLLKTVMEQHGFVNYHKEWWHFRLRDEPFPKEYFNFPTSARPADND